MAAKLKITKCSQGFLPLVWGGVICFLGWEGVGGGNYVFYVCTLLYSFSLNVCVAVSFSKCCNILQYPTNNITIGHALMSMVDCLRQEIMADNITVNCISWNTKGLNHINKRNRVLSHLRSMDFNVAFLQETHLRSSDHNSNYIIPFLR